MTEEGAEGGGGPGQFQVARVGGGGPEPVAAWCRWVWLGDARGREVERGKGPWRMGHYGLAGVASPKGTMALCNYSKIFKWVEII
jgi:hypothetical protein